MYSMEHFVIKHLNFSEYWINVKIINKNGKYYNVGTVPKYNWKIVTHIYDHSLSWLHGLGRDILIKVKMQLKKKKSGGVKI